MEDAGGARHGRRRSSGSTPGRVGRCAVGGAGVARRGGDAGVPTVEKGALQHTDTAVADGDAEETCWSATVRSAKTRGLGVGAQVHCLTLNVDAEGNRAALEFCVDAMGDVGTSRRRRGKQGRPERAQHARDGNRNRSGQVRTGRDGGAG